MRGGQSLRESARPDVADAVVGKDLRFVPNSGCEDPFLAVSKPIEQPKIFFEQPKEYLKQAIERW